MMSPAGAATGGRGRRVRVLHVIQNLNYGGMERLLADIARRLDPERFEPHILALQYLGHFAQGLEPYAMLHLAHGMTKFSLLRPHSLARQIARIAPDVVHTHSGVWYKATRAARMAGVPRIIHTEHGRPTETSMLALALDARAALRTDVVVAVSEVLSDQLRSGVAARSRVEVVRNGVDTDNFAPAGDDGALRKSLGIPLDAPVIGSVGRLEPIKSYDLALRAFRELRAFGALADSRLLLGGDGSERPQLERLATELGISGSVVFMGWTNDPSALHRAMTLFTMSSKSEGTSVSLLEAMSAGICPVVTDVGGNGAVLGSPLAHRLVPYGDPAALAAAWRDALARPDALKNDARAARQRVLDSYSLNAMVRAYEQLYVGS